MAELNTDEIIATSKDLMDDSLPSHGESVTGESDETSPAADSLMESDSLNEDSLNGSSDSVGDTYQAVSFVSKSQKKLYPSDLPPPCMMDQNKVRDLKIDCCV